VKLPPQKVLMPGVVTHSTDLIEHPELVSERIQRFARVVGADRVIASTDCGFAGRTHPQIRLGQAAFPVAGSCPRQSGAGTVVGA
jgi:5-methyltetrahydropteroyltriglutamate--homocysteine methyltransferase